MRDRTVTIELSEDEYDFIMRYCLLRGVKGALIDNDYVPEVLEAAKVFNDIQTKLGTALRKKNNEDMLKGLHAINRLERWKGIK